MNAKRYTTQIALRKRLRVYLIGKDILKDKILY